MHLFSSAYQYQWSQLSNTVDIPLSMEGANDFLQSDLPDVSYESISNVRCFN